MEGRLRRVLIMFMVLGVLVGQSEASFGECYKSCFILCIIKPENSVFSCSVKCLKNCIKPVFPLRLHRDGQHFCKLGCATSLCTSISTSQDPGEAKVEDCVNSCSKTCGKKD